MGAHSLPVDGVDSEKRDVEGSPSPGRRRGMSSRNRLLFFLAAWLTVLMPFLFWWSTWFGRPLNARQMAEYLRDDQHPRHIQHAIVQLGERMIRRDPSATAFYPDLVRLASHAREEVRSTDAWAMGQDPSGAGFHDVLLKLLDDPSVLVRGNAALSLVRFGDGTGRAQIVALLEPATITTPYSGQVVDSASVGTAIHQGGLVAKIQDGGQLQELRSPITGRIGNLAASRGARVGAGESIATVEPAEEQIWEALRALYLVGQPADLPTVRRYERDLPEISDRVRQQAIATDRAIQDRARN